MKEKLADMGVEANVDHAVTNRKRKATESLPDEAVKDADAAVRDEVMAREMSNLGFRNVRVSKKRTYKGTYWLSSSLMYLCVQQKLEADKQKKLVQLQANKHGRRGEADRAIQEKMPKHLFSGKTSLGSRDRR